MTSTVQTHLSPAAARAALAADVAAGLADRPRTLPPKWFYDERGSELFDAITRLPEYYPTRTERGILAANAAEIAALSGAHTLVELGSGTSEKTGLLLDALRDAGTLGAFVALDVDPTVLAGAGRAIAAEYPAINVHQVVGDFEHHLALLPVIGRRMVAFLGSTVGNLDPVDRARFLAALLATLQPGETLLLGVDLVKEPAKLVAAYDDAAGITAAFNRNVLAVINRELGADFALEGFEHQAVWDSINEWMEMRLVSVRDQQIRVPGLDAPVVFQAGEYIRTEISAKFRLDGIRQELIAAGLRPVHVWTDPAGDFAVILAESPAGG